MDGYKTPDQPIKRTGPPPVRKLRQGNSSIVKSLNFEESIDGIVDILDFTTIDGFAPESYHTPTKKRKSTSDVQSIAPKKRMISLIEI